MNNTEISALLRYGECLFVDTTTAAASEGTLPPPTPQHQHHTSSLASSSPTTYIGSSGASSSPPTPEELNNRHLLLEGRVPAWFLSPHCSSFPPPSMLSPSSASSSHWGGPSSPSTLGLGRGVTAAGGGNGSGTQHSHHHQDPMGYASRIDDNMGAISPYQQQLLQHHHHHHHHYPSNNSIINNSSIAYSGGKHQHQQFQYQQSFAGLSSVGGLTTHTGDGRGALMSGGGGVGGGAGSFAGMSSHYTTAGAMATNNHSMAISHTTSGTRVHRVYSNNTNATGMTNASMASQFFHNHQHQQGSGSNAAAAAAANKQQHIDNSSSYWWTTAAVSSQNFLMTATSSPTSSQPYFFNNNNTSSLGPFLQQQQQQQRCGFSGRPRSTYKGFCLPEGRPFAAPRTSPLIAWYDQEAHVFVGDSLRVDDCRQRVWGLMCADGGKEQKLPNAKSLKWALEVLCGERLKPRSTPASELSDLTLKELMAGSRVPYLLPNRPRNSHRFVFEGSSSPQQKSGSGAGCSTTNQLPPLPRSPSKQSVASGCGGNGNSPAHQFRRVSSSGQLSCAGAAAAAAAAASANGCGSSSPTPFTVSHANKSPSGLGHHSRPVLKSSIHHNSNASCKSTAAGSTNANNDAHVDEDGATIILYNSEDQHHAGGLVSSVDFGGDQSVEGEKLLSVGSAMGRADTALPADGCCVIDDDDACDGMGGGDAIVVIHGVDFDGNAAVTMAADGSAAGQGSIANPDTSRKTNSSSNTAVMRCEAPPSTVGVGAAPTIGDDNVDEDGFIDVAAEVAALEIGLLDLNKSSKSDGNKAHQAPSSSSTQQPPPHPAAPAAAQRGRNRRMPSLNAIDGISTNDLLLMSEGSDGTNAAHCREQQQQHQYGDAANPSSMSCAEVQMLHRCRQDGRDHDDDDEDEDVDGNTITNSRTVTAASRSSTTTNNNINTNNSAAQQSNSSNHHHVVISTANCFSSRNHTTATPSSATMRTESTTNTTVGHHTRTHSHISSSYGGCAGGAGMPTAAPAAAPHAAACSRGSSPAKDPSSSANGGGNVNTNTDTNTHSTTAAQQQQQQQHRPLTHHIVPTAAELDEPDAYETLIRTFCGRVNDASRNARTFGRTTRTDSLAAAIVLFTRFLQKTAEKIGRDFVVALLTQQQQQQHQQYAYNSHHQHGSFPPLASAWAAPPSEEAQQQQCLPDADHTWTSPDLCIPEELGTLRRYNFNLMCVLEACLQIAKVQIDSVRPPGDLSGRASMSATAQAEAADPNNQLLASYRQHVLALLSYDVTVVAPQAYLEPLQWSVAACPPRVLPKCLVPTGEDSCAPSASSGVSVSTAPIVAAAGALDEDGFSARPMALMAAVGETNPPSVVCSSLSTASAGQMSRSHSLTKGAGLGGTTAGGSGAAAAAAMAMRTVSGLVVNVPSNTSKGNHTDGGGDGTVLSLGSPTAADPLAATAHRTSSSSSSRQQQQQQQRVVLGISGICSPTTPGLGISSFSAHHHHHNTNNHQQQQYISSEAEFKAIAEGRLSSHLMRHNSAAPPLDDSWTEMAGYHESRATVMKLLKIENDLTETGEDRATDAAADVVGCGRSDDGFLPVGRTPFAHLRAEANTAVDILLQHTASLSASQHTTWIAGSALIATVFRLFPSRFTPSVIDAYLHNLECRYGEHVSRCVSVAYTVLVHVYARDAAVPVRADGGR